MATPIIRDLSEASWPNWREALREVFIVLTFSLMPLWLGLILVALTSISEGASEFFYKFAASSDLGILSAALLGPMLYMMFRADDTDGAALPLIAKFPSGLWFVALVVICCVLATAMYSMQYLSTTGLLFSKEGTSLHLMNEKSVAKLSCMLLVVSTLLVLFAATIHNALMTRAPRMMSDDTTNFVEEARSLLGPTDGDGQGRTT